MPYASSQHFCSLNFIAHMFLLKRNYSDYTEQELFNFGLGLAMEFGEHWLQPIDDRVMKKIPDIPFSAANNLNTVCQKAMSYGHRLVSKLFLQKGQNTSFDDFKSDFSKKFPLTSSKNMSHLFSQGMYYVMK